MRPRPAILLCTLALLFMLVGVAVAFARTPDGSPAADAAGAAAPSLDVVLAWNTFLGGAGVFDDAAAVATDAAGNAYVVGSSDAAWGAPVRAYAASDDVSVAKLGPSGALLWHSFIGGAGQDFGRAVAVDVSGNVYVAGVSNSSWGAPLRAHTGSIDAFVARIDSSGHLLWHAFLGADDEDDARGLCIAPGGGVVVAGTTYGSSATGWDAPLREHSGGYDAFVARLSSAGVLVWNTFLGSQGGDHAGGLTTDGDGDLFVTGWSNETWGAPVRPHFGTLRLSFNAFVAKLTPAGALTWNTFLGADYDPYPREESHYGDAVAVDAAGKVYVAGDSYHTWGTPIRAFSASSRRNTFVAGLTPTGALEWSTFLCGDQEVWAEDSFTVLAGSEGGVYVAGSSAVSWGTPLTALHGNYDAYIARLSSAGALSWNTFVGGGGAEQGRALAVTAAGDLLLAGYANATWGAPVRSHEEGWDGFAAKVELLEVTPTTIHVTAASRTLAKYGEAYSLSGSLTSAGTPLPGRSVTLQTATASAGPWSSTAVTAATAADGTFSLRHVPRSRTFYRARFAAAGGYGQSESDVRSALPRAWVGNPAAPSVMYEGRAATVKGQLKPRHGAGTFPVRIYQYRYVNGVWKSHGYVKAKAADFSTFTKYSATVKLPSKGMWRLRAQHPADAGHAASWSAMYDTVLVR